MGRAGTLDSRLKKIRKELSLIDKDLKDLSDVASNPDFRAPKPKLRSKELRNKESKASPSQKPSFSKKPPVPSRQQPAQPERSQKRPALIPEGTEGSHKEDRFLEYLSSSFHSGRPLGQERRIQRNKAILMLVIVVFILFLVLYRLTM